MKKVIPYLLFILLAVITVGCNKKNFYFEENKIYQIQYQNQIILEQEYKEILKMIQEIPFHQEKQKTVEDPDLIITTENSIYKFKQVQGMLYYQKGTEVYQSEKGQKLYQKLEEIQKKYQDQNFYKIEVIEKEDKDAIIVKLDNSDTYLKITTDLSLQDFKIHSIEKNDNNYQDINLLYQKDLIPQTSNLIVRYDPSRESKIRITFTSPYQYQISIIPEYDEKTKQILFKQTFTNKKSFQ